MPVPDGTHLREGSPPEGTPPPASPTDLWIRNPPQAEPMRVKRLCEKKAHDIVLRPEDILHSGEEERESSCEYSLWTW